MKTHTHTKKDFLPAYFRDARCIRYISPLYDYENDWEDDEGYVHEGDRVCINEDQCTNHTALAHRVHIDEKPLYFFRRTLPHAKWSHQHLSSLVKRCNLPLKVARFNRRVLIIPSDQHLEITESLLNKKINKKIDSRKERKYNTDMEINFDQ